MGLFGKKNNCKFKDMCNIAGVDGTCRFCATENYQDCDLYQDWSGGGINENNQCPHKDKCPHFPVTCLWGNDPESCFHYEDFEPTSYDNSYSSCGGNDDNYDSEKNVYEQALQREVEVDESVKAARAKAEVERIKLQQQIDAAEQRAKLAELERKRKNEEEWQERQDTEKNWKTAKTIVLPQYLQYFSDGLVHISSILASIHQVLSMLSSVGHGYQASSESLQDSNGYLKGKTSL